MLQITDWIGIAVLVIGVVGTAAGAYWASRKKGTEIAADTLVSKIHELHLSNHDRSLLEQVSQRLSDATDRLRHATDDLAAAVDRNARR